MGNVKIRIKIELVECDDTGSGSLLKEADGSFTRIITDDDSVSIDKCESAMMETVYPTVREILSGHFADVSKKKLLRMPNPEK